MCGICGIFFSNRDWRVQGDMLARINRSIVHRGPDDEGFFVEENVGLAMRRLSIIDVKTGHQPIANENRDIWIVFNGEIYNHSDLRSDLEKRGHQYRTRSDTETIIHLYEEYGSECVKHLRGMFAFVIWDRRKRVLFAARDRLGIKPFYYRWDGQSFLFGSEIKTILTYPGIEAEFDQSRSHAIVTWAADPVRTDDLATELRGGFDFFLRVQRIDHLVEQPRDHCQVSAGENDRHDTGRGNLDGIDFAGQHRRDGGIRLNIDELDFERFFLEFTGGRCHPQCRHRAADRNVSDP